MEFSRNKPSCTQRMGLWGDVNLVVVDYFQWDAAVLVFFQYIALGVEAAKKLAVGQVVALAGPAESCEK